MRFLKSRNNGTAPKTPSARGQESKSVNPKYDFEFEDPSRETENDSHDSQNDRNIEMDLLLARLRSRATKQHVGDQTTRYENEDPKANKLFQDVPGYKEGLRPELEGQKKRTSPYACPPANVAREPVRPTRRIEGDDPAADQLLAGASERQRLSQLEDAPVPVSMVNEESPMIKSAREMRGLGLSGRNRKKGEDPAADALFKSSGRP
ncbi:hypothetical protein INS49_013672 [Diaporthe citri]|uniref:uncharacterized protein n=1 Tax=Diaporthe citri TaxID=83186 RepID=UPI001C7EB551|nr:uncharacterized protein INS49_013672 [Diaporthe citri]KAG6357793.1 hypothetical protein INS49_013672 [Diaporthe citri]